jgi:hypothetical protein
MLNIKIGKPDEDLQRYQTDTPGNYTFSGLLAASRTTVEQLFSTGQGCAIINQT